LEDIRPKLNSIDYAWVDVALWAQLSEPITFSDEVALAASAGDMENSSSPDSSML